MPLAIIEIRLEKAPDGLLDGLIVPLYVYVSSLFIEIEGNVEVAVDVLHLNEGVWIFTLAEAIE